MSRRSTAKYDSRVLIIGLDGATFDVIAPWASEGLLPTFASLMKEGSWGPLRSIIPPYSLGAWSTLATGKNPGKHGVLDFWQRDFNGYGFRLQNASSRVGDCVWRILSRRGRKVIVLNVPMTYPPEKVNGVMVSGMDTPGMDAPYTFPRRLKQELEKSTAGYMIMPNDWLQMRRNRPDLAKAELFREIEVRFSAARYLMERHPWDFAMFVSTATDGAAHFFWKYFDPEHPLYDAGDAEKYATTILEVYQRVDAQIGRMLADLPDDAAVILVSDHGNGGIGAVALHLNLWLQQQGLLGFRKGTPELSASSLLISAFQRSKEALYDVLPFQRLERLRRLFPDVLRRRLTAKTFFPDIDWCRTKAYSEEFRGHIWVNLRTRDPQGIVRPGEEYETIRDMIVEGLSQLQHPRLGGSLLSGVYRREELYHGPFVTTFPDLLLESSTAELFRRHDRRDRTVPPLRVVTVAELQQAKTTGGHLLDGIFVAWGKAIKKGVRIQNATLMDVVPTTLYMLGEPIPEGMDGRVLTELFRTSFLSDRPPTWTAGGEDTGPDEEGAEQVYSDEEAERVKERLEGLGYLG